MSFNKVTLIGNLGSQPELRYTPQGQAVCSFSLATNEKRRGEDYTMWFKVTMWGKQAEAAERFLAKGRPVYIEGRLRREDYTDREGNAKVSLEVTATEMQFIGTGRDTVSDNGDFERQPELQREEVAQVRSEPKRPSSSAFDDDLIPF